MLELNYDYDSCVRNSEKVAWTIDQVLPAGTSLDFSRPFLPDALSGASKVSFLDATGKRLLNQITGNSYLNLFAFVEEYIIAMAVQHAHAEMFGDHAAMRALVRFADEELKHQALFQRFCEMFARDFKHPCGVLGAAAEIAGVILERSAMAVLLVTLHLEIMTQAHYTESVRDDQSVDPLFAGLLKHHWMEEAQHAKIDALELRKLASDATPEQIELAFNEYLDLTGAVDGLLGNQAKMDAESLAGVLGRPLTVEERDEVIAFQHAAYRRSFLTYGMTHRTFAQMASSLSESGAKRIAQKASELA